MCKLSKLTHKLNINYELAEFTHPTTSQLPSLLK